MASGQEDVYSYDFTALVDYEPDQTTAPPTIGVGGGRLHTPSPPTTASPGIGVGTNNTSPSILANVTVGVGGARTLRQQAGRPPHLQVKDTWTTELQWHTNHRYKKGKQRATKGAK